MQQTTSLISDELQECIYNNLSCHAICLETITECLRVGGKYAAAEHIKMLQDCVRICMTSADFMLRGSDFYKQICGVCAEICGRCAKACKAMSSGNDFMTRCAEACHRCAENCRRMSSSATAASFASI